MKRHAMMMSKRGIIVKKGIVFNIQKFSIHDGPGIRTTVFLKGCPLKCQWCSNPESQLQKLQVLYDIEKCIKCQSCIQSCPNHAIILKDNHIFIDHHQCLGCLSCVSTCPTNALSSEGENKSIEDIVNICLQDIDFYEESDGGVTISGGEGMMQVDFVEAFVNELHQHHLHVAIETTGYIQEKDFQRLAPLFDLLLFDVKHYDPIKHKEGTGVPNDLIIHNLKWAVSHNIKILPRIPVIPCFNDSIDDAIHFSDLLLNTGLKKVQLLPFHQFGERKYELLNKKYLYKDKKALYPEDLKDYQQIFIDQGLDCFF